ncbi:MAG: hypothetical protein AB1483_00560 [Candidatus Zixiibacteriota bacterium]
MSDSRFSCCLLRLDVFSLKQFAHKKTAALPPTRLLVAIDENGSIVIDVIAPPMIAVIIVLLRPR